MFKKGDVVVAKSEYIDKTETLRDTAGIVLEYKLENDYLLLGVLNPEKYSIPPTLGARGCFYRRATQDELLEFCSDA